MSDEKVRRLMEDIRLANPENGELADRAREAVRAVIPEAAEKVMYGGFMFSAPSPFCGVFAYTAHVSVEFGAGARLADPHGVLEGKGKGRRHIKLRSVNDIDAKHLVEYVRQAWQAALDGI